MTKVTESLFNAVKILIENGATSAECAKYMKISTATVSVIRNSETYEEYKHNMHLISGSERKRKQKQAAAIAAKAKADAQKTEIEPQAAPAENKQTIVVQASHYMLEEQKRTNELLTLISNKLAFIIDELTGTKTGT